MIANPPRNLGFGAVWQALWCRPRCLIFGLWFTLFPLLFIPLVFALSTAFPREADYKKISTQGQETPAEVVRIETVYNMTINDVHPKRVFFKYEAGGEDKQASMDTLSIDETTDWKPGRQIQIRYLAGDAVIPSLQPVDFPFFIFYLMPFIFMIIGLPFIIFSGFGAKRNLRILKHGATRKASLLSLTPISSFGSIGFLLKTRFEAIYSFVSSQGQPVIGKSQTTDLLLLNEKKKGDEIEILVLPENESWSQVIDGPTLAQIS